MLATPSKCWICWILKTGSLALTSLRATVPRLLTHSLPIKEPRLPASHG